jgi:3,4-dihydroxy 2-butanone 4-phosphate synthase/GTP cyclohydrolase II
MARRPDLIKFAQFHGLKIATIADLIAYRRRYDRIVARKLETTFESRWGGAWRLYIYVNTVAYVEHVALVKGDIATPGPVLVRMHALNVLDDVLGAAAGGRGAILHAAMEEIAREGRGVVVLLREALPTSLLNRLQAPKEGGRPELRDYGVGAQILLDLGIREMELLTNAARTIVALEGYGLTVTRRRQIPLVRNGA